jgi:succinylglutamate desuccinylase
MEASHPHYRLPANLATCSLMQWVFSWDISSILEFDSWIEGPTTSIMAWVHWNEIAWILAMNELYEKLHIVRWKVFFILANLEAISRWTRFYERNMNTCFRKWWSWVSYEERRVREIIPLLERSDYLLDLHNTLNTENSIPFLISEYPDIWKHFEVPIITSWFDQLHPWASDWFMNSIWKVWICLESWSIYDPVSYSRALDAVMNFLRFTGNIEWDPLEHKWATNIVFDYIYINKSMNFQFIKQFKDFEKVRKWQLIARDDGTEIFSEKDGYILFPYNPKRLWTWCFCIGYIA